MKNIKPLLTVIFLLYCFFIGNAQSEKITRELNEADNKCYNKNYKEAKPVYLKHAALLTPIQQYNLALCYYNEGANSSGSYNEGMKWLVQSANRGYTEAMTTIAYCYQTGLGVPKDSIQQFIWVKKAADFGDANALVTMGYSYQKGSRVPKDLQKAKELYIKAIEKGNSSASYFLGLMEKEAGNSTNAFYYMEKSARQAYVPATYEIAKMYDEGYGNGKKDLDEAFRWYHKISYLTQYAKYYNEATNRMRSLGTPEPSTNLEVVKPLLLKLISRANESFYDLKGRIIEPYNKSSFNDLGSSKSEYYAPLLDLGFKNAFIRKENYNQVQINKSIKNVDDYTYYAEVVHTVKADNSFRIYTQWANIFKNIFTDWTLSEKNFPEFNRGETTLYKKLSNGRTTRIVLKTCCPTGMVVIEIKNFHNPQ